MLRFLGSVLLCLREDLKEKAGRLKDFCLPRKPITLSFLSFTKKKKKIGPGRTVMCSLCIIFSLITFFATNNNNPIFYNFLYWKKKTNSGSKSRRVCQF